MGEWVGVFFLRYALSIEAGVHKEQVTRRRTHEDVIVELPRCSFRLEIVPNRKNKRINQKGSKVIRCVPTGIMYW
ncbi:hypothetical protein M0657_005987 [Pyricularia oryzae]|nr:hypothetical protein M0657_005987 [Pyricularia oryzae]KAI7926147.1 hypothetical protein M9X92_002892 [Pyricularia oryzae]